MTAPNSRMLKNLKRKAYRSVYITMLLLTDSEVNTMNYCIMIEIRNEFFVLIVLEAVCTEAYGPGNALTQQKRSNS